MATKQLPTNRDFITLSFRWYLTLSILFFVDCNRMKKELDTIAFQHQHEKPSPLFFGRKTTKILNEELELRGIDFKVPSPINIFGNLFKSITALNLLAEDYNRRGC